MPDIASQQSDSNSSIESQTAYLQWVCEQLRARAAEEEERRSRLITAARLQWTSISALFVATLFVSDKTVLLSVTGIALCVAAAVTTLCLITIFLATRVKTHTNFPIRQLDADLSAYAPREIFKRILERQLACLEKNSSLIDDIAKWTFYSQCLALLATLILIVAALYPRFA